MPSSCAGATSGARMPLSTRRPPGATPCDQAGASATSGPASMFASDHREVPAVAPRASRRPRAVRSAVTHGVLARDGDRVRVHVDRTGAAAPERERDEREDAAAAADVEHRRALERRAREHLGDERRGLVQARAERAPRLEHRPPVSPGRGECSRHGGHTTTPGEDAERLEVLLPLVAPRIAHHLLDARAPTPTAAPARPRGRRPWLSKLATSVPHGRRAFREGGRVALLDAPPRRARRAARSASSASASGTSTAVGIARDGARGQSSSSLLTGDRRDRQRERRDEGRNFAARRPIGGHEDQVVLSALLAPVLLAIFPVQAAETPPDRETDHLDAFDDGGPRSSG